MNAITYKHHNIERVILMARNMKFDMHVFVNALKLLLHKDARNNVPSTLDLFV